jgi:hypothetical protein
MDKLKPPLRAALAKQNRVGYSSIDIIAELYSHPFESIIAEYLRKSKGYPLKALAHHFETVASAH